LKKMQTCASEINKGCYNYLLEYKDVKLSKKLQQKNDRSFQPTTQKDNARKNLGEIVELKSEVSQFTKEIKRENIERKKSKYIAAIFDRKKRPKSPPRLIKTTNLFQDASLEDTASFFEYQLMIKMKNAHIAKASRMMEQKKKFQALPWRSHLPQILHKAGYKMPPPKRRDKIIEGSDNDESIKGEEFNNKKFSKKFTNSMLKSKANTEWEYKLDYLKDHIKNLSMIRLLPLQIN